MYVKVLIVYLVCFYVLNTVSLFKPLQQRLYSSFYVKDENNIRGLMYEPYDFSDVRNILLGVLITPYGLSVLLFLITTILLSYISYRWFLSFYFLFFISMILAHYFIYVQSKGYGGAVIVIRLLPSIMTMLAAAAPSSVSKNNISTYSTARAGKKFLVGTTLIFLLGIVDYVVSYNYVPEKGKYEINTEDDYKRIFIPKWKFVSQLIPIYILLFVILREKFEITNPFIIAATIGTLFSIGSYILY